MKALLLEDIGRFKYKDLKQPELAEGNLLVKVHAAGVCGSDIPRGYRDGAHNMPLIIGHEFSGQVVDACSDEDKSLIGKRVGVFPLIPCGSCSQCRKRHYEMCKSYNYIGSRCNGAFAEYVAVPRWNIIELPDNVTYEEAAMLEPMAVAVHAIRRVSVGVDDTCIVCGLGTIGTLLTMFLIEKGVKNILVAGNKDFQKTTMLKLGIAEENYCDIRNVDISDFVKDKTGGEGVDVFFECVGSEEVISEALKVTAPAGRICYIGNPHSDIELDRNDYWQILRRQLTITGTWNSTFYGEAEDAVEDDWHYVVDRLANGRINPAQLITHKYPLEKLETGMLIMRDKTEDYIKIMAVD